MNLTQPKYSFLESKPLVILLGFVLVIAWGALDFATGPEIGFSIFYFIPLMLVTWYAGRKAGVTISLACGVAWFTADTFGGYEYAHLLIPFWNAIMRISVFLIVTFLLSHVKLLTQELQAKIFERTADLEADIARRKQIEQALTESEKKYKDLVENSLVGVYKTNLWGELLYANMALVEMFEFPSPEEMMAEGVLLRYKNLADRERLIELLKKTGSITNFELEVLTKTGKTKHLLLSASIENDTISGMARDTTDLKRLEKRLSQTQKLESLGTLAGGIAHDFNNILGIILGHATVVERMYTNPAKVARGIEAIIGASQRGAGLVRQLLTFARKADVLLESVHVNTIVSELSTLLSETFPKTIIIKMELAAGLPIITADLNQLLQVFINFCLNARDAMPHGGTLRIKTRLVPGKTLLSKFPGATSPDYVVVEITDTGTGMDEDIRSRIFEPFFTTKERGKGTGLGLAVAFGIMESHSGFIDVESEPGRGTTFFLYFPAKPAGLEMPDTKRALTEHSRGGTETIFIIEDEEQLRLLAETVLVGKGYTVLGASDGKEAVEKYHRHWKDIDLVFSDMGLPQLSGYDVFKELVRINPSVKFILTSGYIDRERKSEVLKLGAKDIIQKPYTPNELLKKVRDALDSE